MYQKFKNDTKKRAYFEQSLKNGRGLSSKNATESDRTIRRLTDCSLIKYSYAKTLN